MMWKRFILSIAVLIYAAPVLASDVVVTQAWVGAATAEQGSVVASMHITSQKNARLVAVSSPISDGAMFHVMMNKNGLMTMHDVKFFSLPAKHTVILSHAGAHIHLVGLKHSLKAGDAVPMTLTIEFADKSREEISVQAEVMPSTKMAGIKNMHDMH